MATTSTAVGGVSWGDGHLITAVDVSTINAGESLDVSHGGPSGAAVFMVTHEVTTAPTDRSVVNVRHIRASDSKTNDTARIQIDTEIDGNLAGAVVRLYFWFNEMASGGIS